MAAKRKQGLQHKDLRESLKCEIDDDNGLVVSRNGDKDLDEDMWPYGPTLCKKPSTPSRELSSPVRAEETGSAHDETSSSGHKDDDDDDEEDSDDLKAIPHDSERLKAFNMFVRLFVDENLDRQVPISKQPKEKIQAIIDSCTRQFPEFGDRARKRIRTYLKSCRRNKKTRDSSSWPESNRPTPAHLTSVQAEQILAQACENESHNAKRMRLGLEPVSQPMPIIPNNCEPARTIIDHFSPANLTSSTTDIKLNNNNNKPESPNCHLKASLHHELTKTVNSTARYVKNTMSSSPANGGFRGNGSPAFHSSHGFTSTPIFSGYPQPNVHNGPTDLSMKSVKPILSHKLNPTEIAAVRQLITGYRESAAFLLRSADELEQLLIQQQ